MRVIIGLYLHHFFIWLEYGIEVSEAYSDSSAGGGAAKGFGPGKRMKHIETQMTFAQEAIASGKDSSAPYQRHREPSRWRHEIFAETVDDKNPCVLEYEDFQLGSSCDTGSRSRSNGVDGGS